MKKIYLLLAGGLLFGSLNVEAQSQRMVLIEEGTNASCGPCASQNPAFNTLMAAHEDKQISLHYQWYFPGYDPMNEHNPTEANGRFSSYYGQNGVPTAMIDGTVPTNSYPGFNGSYPGSPAGYSASMITDRYAVPASFDIDIDYTITPTTLTATVTVTATQAVSNMSQLKLRIAAIEKEINFASAPGSNGETTFHSVMKKFLGGMAGMTLNANWAVGDSQEFTESWTHVNVYDYSELSVVAFVQNDANKEVMQAALAQGAEFESSTTNSAAIITLNADDKLCPGSNTINPTVKVRNTGNANLTSCDLVATINGVEVVTPWTGNLPLMGEADFTLNDITFETVAGVNELNVECQNTNNNSNEETVTDASTELEVAAEVMIGVKVTVVADNYGSETYWRIIDEAGAMVAQGGNENVGSSGNTGGVAPSGPGQYANGSTNVHDVPLPADGCYTFEIYDYYGDGICCAYGNGSYSVKNLSNNQTILSGGEFQVTDNGKFNQVATAIDENVLSQSFNFFPNPVSNEARLQLTLSESAPVVIELFDLVGKMVYSQSLGKQPAGEFVNLMDFSNMTNGMYMLNVTAGGQKVTRKVTVSK
jgi:hypothetical protein